MPAMWFWISQCTRSKDEQEPDPTKRYKPFPDKAYLRHLLGPLIYEPVIFIEKSRTMMASWLCSAYIAYRMFTEPGIRALIQSEDEDRAVHDVEYIKILWEQSDKALRDRWKLPGGFSAPFEQSYRTFELANRSVAFGMVGNPDKIRSEHPSIYLADEAAFMTRGEHAFNQAVATRCKKIICLSSAAPGWFREFTRDAVPVDWPDYERLGESAVQPAPERQYLTEEHEKQGWFKVKREERYYCPIPGLSMRRAKSGAAVIRCHYTADPDINEDRKVFLRRMYTSQADWDMEMEIKYEAKDGQLIFPTFDPSVHVIPHASIPEKLVRFMAIDPHPRTPHAFLWIGLDRSEIYVYRELWPSVVYAQHRMLKSNEEDNSYTVREYAQFIADWEGNEIQFKYEGSEREEGRYVRKGGGEYIVDRYMDQAGKGFRATGENEQPESYAERYYRYGIECGDPYKRREPGFDKIRELLIPRKHDKFGSWPRLHISDQCPELIFEMQRLRYEKERRPNDEKELKQSPIQSRSHLVDLLRYLATADLAYIEKQASGLSVNHGKYTPKSVMDTVPE